MNASPEKAGDLPPTGSSGRPVDVRSRWVVMASWVGFGVGVALFLLPAAFEGLSVLRGSLSGPFVPPSLDSVLTACFWGLVAGPLFSWLAVRPLSGRLASTAEAFVLPIYRAFAWKPERFKEIYGEPLPGAAPRQGGPRRPG